MADLNQFLGGGGIKSVQTGFIDRESYTGNGSGEDEKYVDVTISEVNVSKSVASFKGGVGISGSYDTDGKILATLKAFGGAHNGLPDGAAVYEIIPRLVNSTTLRLALPAGPHSGGMFQFQGRWTVVEGK